MTSLRILLLAISMPIAAQSGVVQAQTTSHRQNPPAVLTVNAPVKNLLEGYHNWTHRRLGSASPDMIKTYMPFIDVYSPSGVSIYHGIGSAKNAAFIHALPNNIPHGKVAQTDTARPTLQEAIDMFPELATYKIKPASGNIYTIFAVTFPDNDQCKAQNDAMDQLKARAQNTGLRVIEVRILK
ncbi:MAG TPA: hypothetical protein VJW20_22810 [Candidatus Angelobacter sp.]|nr:hypothetical protein [Candidatus Angelobacter sp.]